jgi:hypothetical protein
MGNVTGRVKKSRRSTPRFEPGNGLRLETVGDDMHGFSHQGSCFVKSFPWFTCYIGVLQ